MHSIETKYGEMDFYIDQEGKIRIHFTEEEIRLQEQLKKGLNIEARFFKR